MATAYTSLLGLALPVTGELSGTWGNTVNTEITSLLDSAIAGTTTISADADITLTTTTGAANESREAIILWTAGGTTTRNITAPAQSKAYIVINKSSSTQSIVLRGAGPTTGVTIIKGEAAVCAWNGTDFIKVSNISGPGTFTDLTVTGVASFADGTAALPSITNTGDTNTGIYFPAADTIAFTEGGAEAMRVDSSGNVGIGTATPTVKLQVTTAAAATLPASSGTTLSAGTLIRLGTSSDSAGGIGTIGLATNQMWIQVTDSTNLATGNQLLLNPNGGNVGIGTSSPSSKLHVVSSSGENKIISEATAASQQASLSLIVQAATPGQTVIYMGKTGATTNGQLGYDPNTNAMTLYTSNSERMRIDSSGNVGIGTSSPAYRLDVGTSSVTGNIHTFGSITSGTLAGYSIRGVPRLTNDTGTLENTYIGCGASAGNIIFQQGNSFTAASNTERMRINSSGNVGIGTASPSQPLDVVGAAQISFSSGVNTYQYFQSTSNYVGRATDGNFWVNVAGGQNILFGVGASEKVRIDSSGNVGIGTTSMTGKFNVTGAAAGVAAYFTDTINSGLAIATLSGGATIGTDGGGAIHLATDGATAAKRRLSIDAAGNVGIGTTSPSAKLQVEGSVVVSGTNTINATSCIMTIGDSTRTASSSITTGAIVCGGGLGVWSNVNAGGEGNFASNVSVFSTNPTSSQHGILFRNTFNVGASIFSTGTATNNGFINWVGGNGTQGSIAGNGSGVTYNTTSDYRLKENVAPMTGALATVAKLRPVTYNWKVDGADGQGFIAHELEAIFPDAVSGEKDGIDKDGNPEYQGIDTSYLVATLTAAIQEQQALITSLTARIVALESN